MQKVIYTNPAGQAVEISPVSDTYVFEAISGTTTADAQLLTSAPAGMDGTLLHGVRLGDREITVTLHVRGDDLADMYDKRQKLIARCSPALHQLGGRLGELVYSNDFGTWSIPAAVKIGAREISGRKGRRYQAMRIVFGCPSPYWRAVDATMSRLAYLSGGFKFPLNIPAVNQSQPGIRFGSRGYRAQIFNAGDSAAPLDITITGVALLPTIEHKGTGEKIIVNRAIDAGDTLHISTQPGAKLVEVTTAIGTVENAMGALDAQSTFFQLLPGDNTLEYSSGNDNTASMIIVRMWSHYSGV